MAIAFKRLKESTKFGEPPASVAGLDFFPDMFSVQASVGLKGFIS